MVTERVKGRGAEAVKSSWSIWNSRHAAWTNLDKYMELDESVGGNDDSFKSRRLLLLIQVRFGHLSLSCMKCIALFRPTQQLESPQNFKIIIDEATDRAGRTRFLRVPVLLSRTGQDINAHLLFITLPRTNTGEHGRYN